MDPPPLPYLSPPSFSSSSTSPSGYSGTLMANGQLSVERLPTPPFIRQIRRSYLAAHPPSPSALPPSTPQAPQPLYLPPPALPEVEEDLVPPENFSNVVSGVYRSGFPKKKNFPFMESLKLKTVLTLVLEEYPDANLKWCQANGINFMQFGIPGNKEPFDNIPEDVICAALVQILDKRNHPILIHCNRGKHRTGCLIGCIRRLQSWSLTSIFDEYRRFSTPKSRAVDQQFIDLFDLDPVWESVVSQKGGGICNLPSWDMLSIPRWAKSRRKALEDCDETRKSVGQEEQAADLRVSDRGVSAEA